MTSRTVFVDATVHSAFDPFATAIALDDGVVTWVGSTETALNLFGDDSSVRVVELDSHLVTPSFINLGAAGNVSERELSLGWAPHPHDRPAPAFAIDPLHARDTDFLSAATAGETPLLFAAPHNDYSPWEWGKSASYLAPSEHRIADRAAYMAATRAPRRVIGIDHPGTLVPGVASDLTIWESGPLIVHANDERVETWSTDPRSRIPLLPDLSTGTVPRPILTMQGSDILFIAPDAQGLISL